ncbi:uncharacterized protein LOC132815825 [Hemiscyllium ocellatum]|uniref:uncharacterized protein LOC132815825 n=1 Tax=Hemiscyllium ocellatum TaxID=170820 RepID=UPI002965EA0E|nr:uncharacterized protein LOC132815825 [Hemiscyllium ocellatum]
MGLEVEEDDVMELVEDHRQEISTEDLVELQQEQVKVIQQEHSGEEEEEREGVSSVQIKDICSKWSEVQAFVERHHPNKTMTNRAVNILNDSVISHISFSENSATKKKTSFSGSFSCGITNLQETKIRKDSGNIRTMGKLIQFANWVPERITFAPEGERTIVYVHRDMGSRSSLKQQIHQELYHHLQGGASTSGNIYIDWMTITFSKHQQ